MRSSLAAVALVFCGALLAALAMTLAGAIAIAAIHAFGGVSTEEIWANRTEIAAIAIFGATYFVIATRRRRRACGSIAPARRCSARA